MKTACRIDDPVIFFEHKGLYRQVFSKSLEPDADYLIPFGKAKIVQPGSDMTAITWGSGVVRCQRAAAELERDGFSVEVIDLRTLVPLDEDLIFSSVRKTGKAIVVHEAPAQQRFRRRDRRAHRRELLRCARRAASGRCDRQGLLPAYAPSLEAAIVPSQDDVTAACAPWRAGNRDTACRNASSASY
jgi:2-oxoisovalerate dehydrogenase E1 component